MLIIRITKKGGRVLPGDYVVEATEAELRAEYDAPSEAVRGEGGVVWWRHFEEVEGVHSYERAPFMSDSMQRRIGADLS